MGAVCYKPKKATLSREDILRAINDKNIRESIIDHDGKTLKTDELQNQLLTFTNFTQQMNIDTSELHSTHRRQNKQPMNKRHANLISQKPNSILSNVKNIELKILSYYSNKDEICNTLPQLSKKSLYFMRKNYKHIDNDSSFSNANERIKFIQVRSMEEHNSGVNQMMRVNQKELVTVSDDCTLKFWSASSLKVESQILTETITCISSTGNLKKEILVAGCHSGNLILINSLSKSKKETINNAHYNLIRVIVSLESLKNKYFVTADVCGIVKVWTSSYKPLQVMEIEQDGAISYNSMIELTSVLPKKQASVSSNATGSYDETSLIAVALKSQKVNMILLIPGSCEYQQIRTLNTQQKPTCLIQLSPRLVAIATGSLKESSHIEIHDVNKGKVVSVLKKHADMIDSLLKIEFSTEKIKSGNPYIQWMLSASRDRQIILWKLIDGRPMKRNIVTIARAGGGGMASSNSQGSLHNNNNNNSNPNGSINKLRKDKQQANKLAKNKARAVSGSQEDEGRERSEGSQSAEQVEPQENSVINEGNREERKDGQAPPDYPKESMQDYFYMLETTHKDFIRSMVQLNENTLLTASEDKTIKIFTIAF